MPRGAVLSLAEHKAYIGKNAYLQCLCHVSTQGVAMPTGPRHPKGISTINNHTNFSNQILLTRLVMVARLWACPVLGGEG